MIRPARASCALSVNIGASAGFSATHRPTYSATISSTRPIARRLEHAVRADPAQVAAHEQRDRDRQPDGHDPPRALAERVHDDEREHGDQHDHDAEHRDERRIPATGPISSFAIWPSDLPLRRIDDAEDDEILHRAAERDADDDPERAGEKSELRGERRPDERAGPAIAAKWWPKTIHRFVGT